MKNLLIKILLCCATALPTAAQNHHQITYFTIQLDGAQVVPPNASTLTGRGFAMLFDGNLLAIGVGGFASADFPANHPFLDTEIGVYGPARKRHNGRLIIRLNMVVISPPEGPWYGEIFELTPAEVAQLRAGLLYVQVQTPEYPDGEMRGQIVPVTTTKTRHEAPNHSRSNQSPAILPETPHLSVREAAPLASAADGTVSVVEQERKAGLTINATLKTPASSPARP